MTANYDCLVIGGGPAGLTAALYLGRFRRRTLLIDAGDSRARRIPLTHNLIGFSDGISGPELLERLRAQCDHYGAERVAGTVSELKRIENGFAAKLGERWINAQLVLLATGAPDVEPELPGLAPAVADGIIRYCPICDAFEARGRRVALVAFGACRIKEALLLRGYTADLTVLTLGQPMNLSKADRAQMQAMGIAICRDPVVRLVRQGDAIAAWPRDAAEPLLFDVLYSALGTKIHSELAARLGARTDKDGALLVDRHQRTTVPGLFAAGDVVQGLSQIGVAAAHAAIAATTMNRQLPPILFEDGAGKSPV